MKYLSNYVEQAQSELFAEMGAFFAFSTKQFNEAKIDGVEYVSVGSGMICPKPNVDALIERLGNIHDSGIAQDVAENGVKAIIHRELANHEAQITGSIEATSAALSGYPITDDDIRAEWGEFMQYCRKHNYF